MTTLNKSILTIVVIVLCVFFGILIVLGKVGAEPLIGLFGVVVGTLISEISHHQSASQDRTHQLRMSALDRRLQTHQEAFSLWRRVLKDIGSTAELSKTVTDCQTWWENNCLYLTPEARQAFVQAYLAAASHETMRAGHDADSIKRSYDTITRAGNLIVQGVELPVISEGEQVDLKTAGKRDA